MLASPSIQMTAHPIEQMLNAAIELGINFTGDSTIGTDCYRGIACVAKYNIVAQMLDSDSLAKLYNCFQINLISRK